MPTLQKQMELQAVEDNRADTKQFVIGRQHQQNLFETLLAHRRELLTFVSRCHLRLEVSYAGAAGEGDGSTFSSLLEAGADLQVTNLSRNVALVGSRTLRYQETTCISIGQSDMIDSNCTLSFAAQVELLRQSGSAVGSRDGGAAPTVLDPGSNEMIPPQTGSVERVSIAPFLTFRLVRIAA
jgi:hypothetical protein